MESEIMTINEFLFDLPLYHRVLGEDNKDLINFIINGRRERHEVDGYNPIEECESTFVLFCSIYDTVQNSLGNTSLEVNYVSGKSKKFDTYEVILRCKRYNTFLHYLVHIEYEDPEDYYEDKQIKYISKVGQYPSVADFHIGQVHKYDKVLSKDKMREFTKAIGLAANGIGIGSFVYLRRIFEHLVSEAFEKAISENDEFDADAFSKAKMNNKIQMLSGYLPDFLVENYSIYGILSKGIHELSEEDCKSYFSILRESIEMILDEKEDNRQKEMKKNNIKKVLSQITREINN